MATFDVIVLILVLLGGVAGLQKGLITGLARLGGKIAAIVIAVVFHQKFIDTIEPFLGLKKLIEPQISAFLAKIIEDKLPAGIPSGGAEAFVQPALSQATLALTGYILNIGSLIVLFILVSLLVNLLTSVIFSPLAKGLSFADRGGGFVFGVVGTLLGLCLIVGLIAPFLASGYIGFLKVNHSVFYPWLIQGYDIISAGMKAYAGDILKNPLEGFPMLKEMQV